MKGVAIVEGLNATADSFYSSQGFFEYVLCSLFFFFFLTQIHKMQDERPSTLRITTKRWCKTLFPSILMWYPWRWRPISSSIWRASPSRSTKSMLPPRRFSWPIASQTHLRSLQCSRNVRPMQDVPCWTQSAVQTLQRSLRLRRPPVSPLNRFNKVICLSINFFSFFAWERKGSFFFFYEEITHLLRDGRAGRGGGCWLILRYRMSKTAARRLIEKIGSRLGTIDNSLDTRSGTASIAIIMYCEDGWFISINESSKR